MMKHSFLLMLLLVISGCHTNGHLGSPDAHHQHTEQPSKHFDHKNTTTHPGTLQELHYQSTTVGIERRLQVYTPPGFDPKKTLPSALFITRYWWR